MEIGGALVTPSLVSSYAQHYFRDVKGVPGFLDLLEIVNSGVPVNTKHNIGDIDEKFDTRWGNHSSLDSLTPFQWEKLFEDFKKKQAPRL